MSKQTQHKQVEVFWGEIASCDHVVQIYQDESVFMDTLVGFIGSGLHAGEATVVIATASHLSSLESRLLAAGHDLVAARDHGQYIAMDAAGTLARFMVAGWPDDERFAQVIHAVLRDARHGGRKVRAFGEMVALLWAQGHHGATVRLEHLWNDFCTDNALALFCAYPRIGATRDVTESLAEVCALHSRVIAA
ncbi:MAG: MEDS domain-containing protein [Luteimonas sp.]